MSSLDLTWWGHASVSLDLAGVRVALDPLLVGRLFHLRRVAPAPAVEAAEADLVVISHLHADHLHLPSLDRFDPRVPIVVPRGAAATVRGLAGRQLVEVVPGDRVDVAGVTLTARAAHHDGRRLPIGAPGPPALGFVLERAGRSCWYPGDTGVFDALTTGLPDDLDLAVVPIGGWGPSLGEHHLDPEQAADAASRAGAAATLAVHYGTFWPIALRRLHPASHERFFTSAPGRFTAAARDLGLGGVLTPGFGEQVTVP